MGKILKDKKHRGAQRDAGPFHPLERLAAENVESSQNSQPQPSQVESAEEAEQKTALSRGQRKRMAKKVLLARKKEFVTTAQGKAIKLREGALGDLNLLSLSLPTPTANSKAAQSKQSLKMTRKNRQRITNIEIAQFQAVLAHPAFQANPLATIQDHLENSIKAASKA